MEQVKEVVGEVGLGWGRWPRCGEDRPLVTASGGKWTPAGMV